MSQPSAAEASMEAIQELVDHHRAHARYHAEALAYWENELAKRKAMLPLNDEGFENAADVHMEEAYTTLDSTKSQHHAPYPSHIIRSEQPSAGPLTAFTAAFLMQLPEHAQSHSQTIGPDHASADHLTTYVAADSAYFQGDAQYRSQNAGSDQASAAPSTAYTNPDEPEHNHDDHVTDLPPQLVFARGSSSQQYSQGNAHAQPAVTQSFFQKVACTFDPLWCVKEGFDIDALEWTTKLKFDALFIHGALHIDDSLIMDAMYENQGAEIPTQICFQFCGMVQRKVPNFRIKTSPGSHETVVRSFIGTGYIVKFLKEQKYLGSHLSSNKIAKAIHVYRGDQDLGSYHAFKHAYHLWIEHQEAEAQDKEGCGRRSRGTKSFAESMRQYKNSWKSSTFEKMRHDSEVDS